MLDLKMLGSPNLGETHIFRKKILVDSIRDSLPVSKDETSVFNSVRNVKIYRRGKYFEKVCPFLAQDPNRGRIYLKEN